MGHSDTNRQFLGGIPRDGSPNTPYYSGSPTRWGLAPPLGGEQGAIEDPGMGKGRGGFGGDGKRAHQGTDGPVVIEPASGTVDVNGVGSAFLSTGPVGWVGRGVDGGVHVKSHESSPFAGPRPLVAQERSNGARVIERGVNLPPRGVYEWMVAWQRPMDYQLPFQPPHAVAKAQTTAPWGCSSGRSRYAFTFIQNSGGTGVLHSE